MGDALGKPSPYGYGSGSRLANPLAFVNMGMVRPGRKPVPGLRILQSEQKRPLQFVPCAASTRSRPAAAYLAAVAIATATGCGGCRRYGTAVRSRLRRMVVLAAGGAFKDAGGTATLGEGVPLPPILEYDEEEAFEFENESQDEADAEAKAKDQALAKKYSKYVVSEDDAAADEDGDRIISIDGPEPKDATATEEEEEEELDPVPDVDPEEVIFGKHLPFAELGMSNKQLLSVLPQLGFNGSTRVQAAAIPQILGKDRRAVIITSETGSGKTLAYLLPAFEIVLRRPPRPKGCPHPAAIIVTPGRELGYQIYSVARQLSRALAKEGKSVRVHSSRTGWPVEAPDILITTPRAAAQGLQPCMSEDEVARRSALLRIRDVELLVFDEADLLLGGGSQTPDVTTVLTALATSLPDQAREVLPEAQRYYQGGVPVEILDEETLTWVPGKGLSNADGTFDIKYGDGKRDRYVSRSRLRGPGIALLIERGPRIVMAGATLATYKKSRLNGVQWNKLFNSGIGSPDWVLKRWFPNALRITSKWIHHRHPGIVQQDWVFIEGEKRKGEVQNMPLRMEKMVKLISEQDTSIRTLVFASTPDKCLAAEMALKAVDVECCGMHASRSFGERLEALKKFATGQVSVLICTDLAARGIDLPLCRHVVQLEFAKNVIDHIHRVGRAARAGRESKTTNYYSAIDQPVVDAILKSPAMGLDGDLIRRRGNRGRLARTRKKQRRQEHTYTETRKIARISRLRTQKTQWTEAATRAERLERAARAQRSRA